MKKTTYQQKIKAPAAKVHNIMLGIDDMKTYEAWTAAFNPTSTYEGNWNKGSKMYFVGTDENGKRGGMISEIAENIPGKFVSIRHYGMLQGEKEITEGPEVEKWAGGHENYTFDEKDGITEVIVEIDMVDDYMEYFNTTWPKALRKLQELAEK